MIHMDREGSLDFIVFYPIFELFLNFNAHLINWVMFSTVLGERKKLFITVWAFHFLKLILFEPRADTSCAKFTGLITLF